MMNGVVGYRLKFICSYHVRFCWRRFTLRCNQAFLTGLLKTSLTVALLLSMAVFFPPPSRAESIDEGMARRIADLLGAKFSPEYVLVTVKDSRAYAEMRGAVLSRIRIDTMKLDALLIGGGVPLGDVDSLSSLIGYSRGELVLLERDVNSYFDNNDTRGFSNLVFDFKQDGFKANGIFTASFIFSIRIRLTASGVLALKSDGVYLEDVSILVENIRQPEALTKQVTSRVNPLIEWSDIPFKVDFKTVSMSEDSAVMTGYPMNVEGGATAIWTESEAR
jgi:hypothetical protein